MSEQVKGVNLQVSHEIVGEIVKAQIGAEVVKALNGADGFVREMVSQVLSLKTNAQGVVSTYSHDNKYSFIESTIGNAVRAEAIKIVQAWVKDNAHKISKEIEKQLAANTKNIAKSFVSLITGNAQQVFRADVKLSGVDDKGDIETLFDALRRVTSRLDKIEAKS